MLNGKRNGIEKIYDKFGNIKLEVKFTNRKQFVYGKEYFDFKNLRFESEYHNIQKMGK